MRAGETEATSAALLSAFFVAFLGARVVLTFAAHLIAPFRLYLIAVGGIGACMILAAVSVPDWFFVPAGAFAGMIFPGYFVEALARMGHGPRVAPVVVGAGLTLATAVSGTLGAIGATVRLAPAEAMRPPAPGRYRRTLPERLRGIDALHAQRHGQAVGFGFPSVGKKAGVIQAQQHGAFFNYLTFTHEDFADDAAFQILDHLNLA